MSKKSTMPEAAKPSSDHDDYETKDHLSTLERAHEIHSDEGKMEKVRKLAGRKKKMLESLTQPKPKKKEISSIKDLKDTYNKKFGPKTHS